MRAVRLLELSKYFNIPGLQIFQANIPSKYSKSNIPKQIFQSEYSKANIPSLTRAAKLLELSKYFNIPGLLLGQAKPFFNLNDQRDRIFERYQHIIAENDNDYWIDCHPRYCHECNLNASYVPFLHDLTLLKVDP